MPDMTIDISKIKPGDKVTLIPLEVVNVYAPRDSDRDTVQVEARDSGHPRIFWVNPNQIAAHHPAPREIGVGDRVFMTDRGRDHAGTVRGVDMPDIWVRWDATFMYRPICRAIDITLVEGDQ